MLLAGTLRLANFITVNSHKPFKWGDWDCNTFVALAIDALNGTNRCMSEIHGKYHDERSAIRFYRDYIRADHYLEQMGWEVVNDQLNNTDILLCDQGIYTAAHIVFANKIWSCHKDHGLVCIDTTEQLTMPYTQWRRK